MMNQNAGKPTGELPTITWGVRKTMNATELALAMLKWEDLKRQADALEADISAAVLEIGKTQTVGNVRASYSKGRTTLDYETAARTMPSAQLHDLMADYEKTTWDWKGICEAADINADGYIKSQSGPSVSLKLLEG